MASAGRRSELKALVFDPQYIQFKPKGAGVTLYFTPEFMQKKSDANQTQSDQSDSGKPEFGAPSCPVRVVKYYHRYMTEHQS